MTTTLLDLIPGGAQRAAGAAPGAVTPNTVVPRVLGLDLSLTGTGIAGPGWADTIKTRPRRKHELRVDFAHQRLDHILDVIDTYLNGVQLAVIENLALGPGMDTDRQLAALNWMVRRRLWRKEIPYALVRPNILKLYVVGKGSRSRKEIAADRAAGKTVKSSTLAAVRGWWPWFDGDDNAADALALCAMGCDRLGRPLITVPEHNRGAIKLVDWPENLYV